MRYVALLRGINVKEMRVGERELYVYFPDGLRRPKLPPLLEKHSTGPATMRNWNTVTRLLALAEGIEEISG